MKIKPSIVSFFFFALLAGVPAQPARAGESPVEFIGSNHRTGTSAAVVVAGDVALVQTTQILPLDQAGHLVGKNNPGAQINATIEYLSRALKNAKSSLDQTVKINIYIARPELVSVVQNVLARKFNGSTKPAVSFVQTAIPHPDAVVAMDAVAFAVADSPKVTRVHSVALAGKTMDAHTAVLPVGGVVYISGQAQPGGNLAEATRKTLESLEASLKFLGLKKSDVVQLKAFTRPMSDIASVQKEFAQFFAPELTPPSSFVEWTSTNPPIEIELIASAGTNIANEAISYLTPPGMTVSPVYSKVTRLNRGKKIYFSSLCAKDSGNGEAQVTQIFNQLGELLKKTGSDIKHLVKATYYVTNNDASNKLNQLRPKFYDPKQPPAASKAMVKGVGQNERNLTVDLIGATIEKE